MTPLDQMIAQDQLQMLKAAIPYASFGLQPSLAILSKWLELQRTIQLFSRPADLSMMSVDALHRLHLRLPLPKDISRICPFRRSPQRHGAWDRKEVLLNPLKISKLFFLTSLLYRAALRHRGEGEIPTKQRKIKTAAERCCRKISTLLPCCAL